MAAARRTSHSTAATRALDPMAQQEDAHASDPDAPASTTDAVAVALAVLTNPTLWRTITSLMSGWPLPLYRFYKERVPTHKLHEQRWNGEALSFPQKRGAIAHVAIIEGNLPVLKLAYEQSKLRPRPAIQINDLCPDPAGNALSFHRVMACATRYGRLEMLQWMLATATKSDERVHWVWEQDLINQALCLRSLEVAARKHCHRSLDVMSFLRDNFPRESTSVPYQFLSTAVESNDLELVAWYHDHGYEFNSEFPNEERDVMDHAASLEMLQLLHGFPDVRCSTRAMDSAAELGSLAMIEFLHEHRSEGCTTQAMDAAALIGHLEIVQFLHENRAEGCTTQAMDFAATGGHLEVVRFLHEHRSEGCTTQAMDMAARNGDLAIVRFLHENRSEGCTQIAMDAAACEGYLDTVTFLHEHRSEGCTKRAMDAALSRGHEDIVAFLEANRTEGRSEGGIAHPHLYNDGCCLQ